MVERLARTLSRTARRIAIVALGGAVLATGIAMIVLPGPAFVVIPAGLGILSLEFAWAARLRDRALEGLRRTRGRGPAERARD